MMLSVGDVVLLDNVRKFAEEEANDETFAKQLAALAEKYELVLA